MLSAPQARMAACDCRRLRPLALARARLCKPEVTGSIPVRSIRLISGIFPGNVPLLVITTQITTAAAVSTR
jgi:hypothetical protein